MKKLTQEEFQERTQVVARARKIFIESGLTKNITDAFILYQEVLAEREREIFIKSTTGGRLPAALDAYERPKCPECGADMGLRIIKQPQGRENVKGYKTCWECFKCGHEDYSHKTVEDWMKELKRKPEVKDDGTTI